MIIKGLNFEPKCKDCKHISLKHLPSKKVYVCDKGNNMPKGKNSKVCKSDYVFNKEFHIKQIKG